MAADGQCQQQGAEDLPLDAAAVQANRQRNCAEQRAERNRCGHQHGIPQDVPLDLESGHARVMHRRDAAAYDGAADPGTCGHARRNRDRKADAGKQDRRDQ
jgi:hypothetical protein